jgi:predicted metalloprotease with PDZ domain
MRSSYLIAATLCLATTVEAQERVIVRPGPAPLARAYSIGPSASVIIGVTTSTSGNARDTLGLLVTSVTPGGPAEQAGILEGNRLQSINGVSLRVPAADRDDPEMGPIVRRRLTRELSKVEPGQEVELQVYADGRTRAVRVRARAREQVVHRPSVDSLRRMMDARPALGIQVGTTGSTRDTLGVFVMGVDDNGPAARAGLQEGMRIAEINGVSLRTSREDIEDGYVAGRKVQQLQREVAKLKVGDDAELKVWQGNQLRTIRVRTVRSADLPSRRGRVIIGDGDFIIPRFPVEELAPAMREMEVELQRLGPALREGIERALDGAGRALRDVETWTVRRGTVTTS